MRFDWYTATVRDVAAYDLIHGILALGDGLWDGVPRPGKARQYQHAVEVLNLNTERTEGWVRWGGNGGGVLVDFSGEASHPVAEYLRQKHGKAHGPSRSDICVDLRGPDLFDQLHRAGVELAGNSHPRISVRSEGDWTWMEAGRSLYFGSSQSEVQVVIYEKGLQLLGKGIDAPRDLVRIELRLRPHKEARRWLPGMSIPDMWGASEFSRKMLERATAISVDRFKVPEIPAADDARIDAFADQWGAHYLRWIDLYGVDGFRELVIARKARRRAA